MEYNDSSIKALKGADRVRKRPAVIFGSDDIRGAFHTVTEILGNSLDEARAGYGDKIYVTYHSDKSITIRDYGRGVPMGWNEAEQQYNWYLVFNEMYAGGKYDASDAYKYSVGLNGLGAASVQYASEWFNVESYTTDKISKISFKRGNPVSDFEVVENTTGETGTKITWKVDTEVFSNIDFTEQMFTELCELQAHLAGITIYFKDEVHRVEYTYEGKGLLEYLRSKVGDKEVEAFSVHNESAGFTEKDKPFKAECDIVLMVTDEMKPQRMFFHNTAIMRNSNGYHHQAFDAALSQFFKELGNQLGIKITPRDYEEYISCIVSTYSNTTSFYNQTKDAVSSQFIYDIVYNTVKRTLELELAKGNESVKAFINNVVIAAQARVKAKQIEQAEKQVKKNMTNKRHKAEKFKDCAERDPSRRELYIVEGDSALGACKQARDSKFQALIPVQGKILNCLKASIEKILENKVITDLTSTIGTGVDLGTSNLFDISKLQFDKIIICTDADVDGFQIRVLIYTMFYRLMPDLLKTGHVYIADTPLFELETNKGSYFAYTVEEKNQMLKDLPAKGIYISQINRSKGLGENTAPMMRQTTMLPETRKLIPLTIDIQSEIVRELSTVLFGNDYNNQRKEFVKELLGVNLAELVDEIETLTEEDRNMEDLDNQ